MEQSDEKCLYVKNRGAEDSGLAPANQLAKIDRTFAFRPLPESSRAQPDPVLPSSVVVLQHNHTAIGQEDDVKLCGVQIVSKQMPDKNHRQRQNPNRAYTYKIA